MRIIPSMTLSAAANRRYARHLTLPEIGEAGQARLAASSVILVGAGGLGSPAALYLAAAGVGRIGLVDFDVVDESNLQRQILYGQSSIGRPKLTAARERLLDLNPLIEIVTIEERLEAGNAERILAPYDVILDGADNFTARYLTNDVAHRLGKPVVHGSVLRFEGQASVFWAKADAPCYRCLFPDPPEEGLVPSCAEAGVLGILPGVIGTIQATEAIKLLLDIGTPLTGRLLIYDALEMEFREIRFARNPDCPLCGDRPRTPTPVASTCDSIEIAPQALAEWIAAGAELTILDVREPSEVAINRIAGSTLIPLRELPERLAELDRERTIVVHCAVGGRSARAAALMTRAGFRDVRNLTGGIQAWLREVAITAESGRRSSE